MGQVLTALQRGLAALADRVAERLAVIAAQAAVELQHQGKDSQADQPHQITAVVVAVLAVLVQALFRQVAAERERQVLLLVRLSHTLRVVVSTMQAQERRTLETAAVVEKETEPQEQQAVQVW
jgi:hypothetical protein